MRGAVPMLVRHGAKRAITKLKRQKNGFWKTAGDKLGKQDREPDRIFPIYRKRSVKVHWPKGFRVTELKAAPPNRSRHVRPFALSTSYFYVFNLVYI